MAKAPSFFSAQLAAIFGAGAASAILFSLIGKGTAFAISLAYLSPLPLMIAMIGFGLAAGLGAGALACLGVGLVAVLQSGDLLNAGASALTFAAALAAPSLWLAFLALRDVGPGPSTPSSPPATASAPAFEKIMSSVVVCSAAVAVGAGAFVAARHGGFEAALARAVAILQPTLESAVGEAQLPDGVDLGRVARAIALAAPPAIAASTLLMLLVNLWLAARVAQKSAQAPRRWPDVPSGLRLPRICAPILAGALATAFLGGPVGVIAATIAAALVMGFALQGLAAIHYLTRGHKHRPLALGLLYLALFALAPPWLLIPCAALGVADSLFGLRARKKAAPARRPG